MERAIVPDVLIGTFGADEGGGGDYLLRFEIVWIDFYCLHGDSR